MTRVNFADLLHRSAYGNAWHGAALLENLQGVSARTAAAHPIPGAHSIWELVVHIAAWNREFAKLLRGGEATLKMNTAQDWPPVRVKTDAAWKKALKELKSSTNALEKVIAGLPDEDLGKKMPGREYDVWFAVTGLPHHLTYHGGQIAILKTAAGSKSAKRSN